MEMESESRNGALEGRSRLARALTLVNECYDNLFEQAPVMLHSIDQYWNLVGVNRKWLTTFGYEERDVLGRRSVDFLAEDSRALAVSETLPLFWRTGSARSIGYEMVRKDGSVLDVLMDADLDTDSTGTRRTVAAIRENHGQTSWQSSVAILQALLRLAGVRRAIQAILAEDSAGVEAPSSKHGDSPKHGDSSKPGDLPGRGVFDRQTQLEDDLMEAVEAASAAVHTLGSMLADAAQQMENEGGKMVVLAESAVEFGAKLQWLTATESTGTL